MKKEININDVGTLYDIAELISNCKKCSLYKTKTKDVPGSGNDRAEIIFIGEAPGKSEDLQGEPFVGAAGKFLNEMLATISLERKDVFIANVLKHRPPQNRDPQKSEIEACFPFLNQQIKTIKPKLVVFLGRHSLNCFFPSLKISAVHGKAFRKKWAGQEQVFLALYHPAAALYNGGMRETLLKDFKKIPTLLNKIVEKEKNNILKQQKLIN